MSLATRDSFRLLLIASALAFGLSACSDDTGSGPTTSPSEQVNTPDDNTTTPGDNTTPDDTPLPEDTPGDDTTTPGDTTTPEEPVEPEEEGLAIFRMTPDKGLASGLEQIEIEGRGFVRGVVVLFGESAAEDVFVLDEQRIAVLTPARTPGLVDVTVRLDETGQSAVLEVGFLFYNPVSVVTIEPANGHVLGGDPITITGTGFLPDSKVLLGDRSAIQVEVIDENTILAVTPEANGVGPVNVHVSNDLGIGSFDDGYLYFDAPELSTVSPPVGPLGGETMVEIRGSGFFEPLAVSFDGRALTHLEVVNSELIRGCTPARDTSGSIDVLVSTTFGTAVGENAFTYLDDIAPGNVVDILAVTPSSGSAAGMDLVTVVAKGLTTLDDTTVLFGDQEAKVLTLDADDHAAVVEVPAGEIGLVDVTLRNENGEDVETDGYNYENFIRVYEVAPGYGPLAGGTDITISGEGFAASAQVRVGPLAAANVVVVDATTITATTPPGAPGLANVTVIQDGMTDTLVGGFAYTTGMDIWVVDPPSGSQAGGTYVKLLGSGFPTDVTVTFDGIPATHVNVISPTIIEAKTPPGDIGTVDVVVATEQQGSVLLPQGYTYFDPESTYGGTWGNGVDGDVNVTVLSTGDSTGIADAFVMLWTNPETKYQGYTNAYGQITFSGPELSGEQMVSASKEGFASSSVVEYNATNITLYMSPTTPPSPGAPGPGEPPPIWKAELINAAKYVPIPWGQCQDKTDTPGALCAPCNTDADCNGMTCSDIPENGRFCTLHCSDNADCPNGFMCYPLADANDQQCVPAAGRVTAFCDFSNPHFFSDDLLPPPGIEVNEDFTIEMPLPLGGPYAIFCWGGIWNDDDPYDPFTPYVLGVRRGMIAAVPGQVFEEQLVLDHPLNADLEARLDIPPDGLGGPTYHLLYAWLDLGDDGVIEFPDSVHEANGAADMVLERVPKVLTGTLYDATFGIYAGAFTPDYVQMMLTTPLSVTMHENLKSLKDDTFYHNDMVTGWTPRSTEITKNINGMWATDADSFIGVGTDGLIIRSLGTGWATQPSGTDEHLNDVHALETGEAIVVGEGGMASHFDGTVWSAVKTSSPGALRGVWMASPTEAVAVGWYSVLHWNGSTWTSGTGDVGKNLRAVWGAAADDVWAVGNYGQVIHYDGSTWSEVETGTTQTLRAVWGSSPNNVYMVGEAATILHWDGEMLRPMPRPDGFDTSITLHDVWGMPGGPVYAVGARGTILSLVDEQWTDETPSGYTASFLTVAGAAGAVIATGAHELLLGPMLTVPENVKPADNGLMGDEYEVSWEVRDGTEPHYNNVEISIPGMMGPIPEWTIVLDRLVTNVLLPDFPDIEGTPGISSGTKLLQILRVYTEGFDIDNYTHIDLWYDWNSWAVWSSQFTKE